MVFQPVPPEDPAREASPGRPAPSSDLTRRRFLQASTGTTILAGMAALGPTALRARDSAGTDGGEAWAKEKGVSAPERIRLAEAGPMLPPVPAVLLSVRGGEGDPDHLSVVWSFVVNGDPPQIGIAPGHEHVARELVGRHGEFVLNVPTAPMVEAFDRVDMSSSRVGDKYALSGFTPGRAGAVDAPTVEEAPIHLECRVFDRIEVPPSRTVFLAQVLATSVHEGVCDATGRLLVERVPFYGMTAGSGEFYSMGKRVGNIGMTVGRNDIRY